MTFDLDRIGRSIAAGLCGSAAHSALMALKSWAQWLPDFQPYSDLQALLTGVVGGAVPALVPWLLSYLNGAVVLGFLYGRFDRYIPGRSGLAKGIAFGLFGWLTMGLLAFPLLGKGVFGTEAGLGLAPLWFTFLMVQAYSVTLGVVYSSLDRRR